MVCLALKLTGSCVVVGFSVRHGGFFTVSYYLMFHVVRSFLVFSGFGLKSLASGFQFYSSSSLKTSPPIQQGILISCTVPSEAFPFVYLASVCRSLQCLISALTQAGRGGLVFRLLVPSRCGEGLALLRLPAVLHGVGPALRAVPALGCSTKARNKKLRLLFVPSPSERLRQPSA